MFDTPVPLADPLVVEVVNRSDSWQPYVPPGIALFGSLIVAAVALYSVWRSNATSMLAISSADERERERWKIDTDREREKWHRDNLLRLCSEALRIAREIQQHYTDAASACTKIADLDLAQRAFQEKMAAAEAAVNKIVPLHYEIGLLGESKVAFEFLELREAAVYVEPAYGQLHDYLVANFDRLHPGDIESAPDLTSAELHESLEFRRFFKASAHISQAIRDFQSVAQQEISPDSKPENAPVDREPWPTPDKDPDLFYADAGLRNSIYMNPSPFDWRAGDTADPQPFSSPASQQDSPQGPAPS